MSLVSCKDYAELVKSILKEEIKTFERVPVLAIIQVGNNPASTAYTKGKVKDCNEVGIKAEYVNMPQNTTQEELESMVVNYANDKCCDGIIVQLPLPEGLDADRITNLIPASKDVDGFRRDSMFDPCTPSGIVSWLKYNDQLYPGMVITVLGRSNLVGKPLVNMLIKEGATVICCNSKTENLRRFILESAIVVSAIGKPKSINEKYFNTEGIAYNPYLVVDVGINRDENNKLCGDIDREQLSELVPNTYVTPVPGGVGLLTRVSLLQNVVGAYKLSNK